jgi:hypothetical protein
MMPLGFAAKVSTNENAQVEELNLQSDQTKEFVQAEGHVIPHKRSAKIMGRCNNNPRADGYKSLTGVLIP